ncbi:beta-glucosidase [Pollutimonas nitritireducens]|uniref:Beta-glucosidase n=1 Tax=Pollutimonas nitritireducens TaxID=2045209 RepID=A0A2N4UH59_9BURK|nr:beta-glucosidase [Pollutimonas nitritireducens]PLC54305.1 beta-glucosidase [Pollutimonas nitritireducens]
MQRSDTDGKAPLFQSFFLGGFECSTHRRTDGVRLDLLRSTRHDIHAERDYQSMLQHGIATVRDGLRWHLIEHSPGLYDWSSFLPQLRAAKAAGAQPIWDICHYGWPDDIDIWSSDFVTRFARFAGAVAKLVRNECDDVPYYCPVNEISFWAWAGADTAKIGPLARRRGMELKRQLVRATVAAIEAMRAVDPRARFVSVDPAIHILPKGPRQRAHAENARLAQYQAFDMIAGELMPELGGQPDYLDIIGVNYYPHNQWVLNGAGIKRGEPLYRPLREILTENWQRYGRPIFIAETGAEAEHRVPWLRYVCDEVASAKDSGVPVEGICLYPVTDYPGWANNRRCPTGLLGFADEHGNRPVYEPLATELRVQAERFQTAWASSTY